MERLCTTILGIYPEAIIAPYLVVGGTDARKYEPVCTNIYRFSPYLLHNSDLSLMHGTNEHISLENLRQVIAFYSAMFQHHD
jgi:carboxypeptidase PM20D1